MSGRRSDSDHSIDHFLFNRAYRIIRQPIHLSFTAKRQVVKIPFIDQLQLLNQTIQSTFVQRSFYFNNRR